MSQQRQSLMVGGNNLDQYNDTTFTKIFVGGLAWETQRDTMKRYFDQFGEILEAVVITDKNTGRSKGYGFVTFKDPEAAMRACQNPSPVIDGRRANCNLASLGANKNRPPTFQHGAARFRPPPGLLASPAYHGSSSTFFHQPPRQYTFPYSAYGYSGYSQDTLYPPSYYNVYGVQQFSPYYPSTGASGAVGLIHNIYPFYDQYAQSVQAHGFGIQYPQMAQFPFLPQHYGSTGILSVPSSMAVPTTSAATGSATTTTISASVAATAVGSTQASGVASDENSTS
ncbi:RNA-binding protein 24-A isoform X1 [Abrus precatorius]|uniref:RNA-binding protein 24-A isoform X1 n=1 Tax=Abrus precatorius TaxID=3816 RepID=A0A8B8K215_ABRPR|nr:RNA-binding protein 24-A isoform X1 [Abrus precatorius]